LFDVKKKRKRKEKETCRLWFSRLWVDWRSWQEVCAWQWIGNKLHTGWPGRWNRTRPSWARKNTLIGIPVTRVDPSVGPSPVVISSWATFIICVHLLRFEIYVLFMCTKINGLRFS